MPVTVMESMAVVSLEAGLFFAFERVSAMSAVNTSEEKSINRNVVLKNILTIKYICLLRANLTC